MTFDWHMLYPLHTVILDNSQVFWGCSLQSTIVQFFKVVFQPLFWGGTHLGTLAILLPVYRAA